MLSGLPLPVAAAVLGSALLHATWNALAKAIPHRLVASALMGTAYLVFGAAWCALAPVPRAASWPFLATSALLQTGYLLLLTAAYAHGEFRRVYPVARGTAPLLVTVFSLTVLGERLHPWQIAGIVLVALSLGGLVLGTGGARGRDARASTGPVPSPDTGAAGAGGGRRPARGRHDGRRAGLGLALATGVVFASYSLVDGIGVRHSGSAAGYAAWLMAVQGPLLIGTCVALAGPRGLAGQLARRGGARAGVEPAGDDEAVTAAPGGPGVVLARRHRPGVTVAAGLAGGALSLVAYAIVLWAQDRAALSLVSATRETSVLFAGVIGAVFFAEGFSARQTVAAVGVVAGVVLMQLG